MFCSNCAKEINDSSTFCPNCGTRVSNTSDMPPLAQSDNPHSQLVFSNKSFYIGLLIVLTGAILMLVALSQDWYTWRCAGDGEGWEDINLNFQRLNDPDFHEFYKLSWFGMVLPLIFVIVFASITILSTFYALIAGKHFRQAWLWLSFLSAAALVANFLYLLVAFITLDRWDNYWASDITFYATPHVGWSIAFIGAIAIGIGSRIKPTS